VTAIAVSRKAGGLLAARRIRLTQFAFALSLFLSAPVSAQLSGSIALDSDYRVRGYSLTGDQPAASAQLNYDLPAGLYANLAGIAEFGHGPRFLGVIAGAGYAKRLSPKLSFDVGLLRSQIGSAGADRRGFDYTEFYAGGYVGPVTGRLSYSPDYRAAGQSTLYSELEAGFEPRRDWHVSGHVGLLTYLNSSGIYRAGDTHRDWRINLQRRFGRFELHSGVSGGSPSSYYGYRVHKNLALTVGTSFSF
jgi:uncharacterized protein (TIGR02001 family)